MNAYTPRDPLAVTFRQASEAIKALAGMACGDDPAPHCSVLYRSLAQQGEDLRNLASAEAERDQLREHLVFVERWAVHHGSKPSITPEEALSAIQHYPAIKAITKGYKDGKVPETCDPWAEIDQLRAEVEALRADAERYQAVRLAGTIHNERRPFWEFSITTLDGQQGPTPERLDADADMLRAAIAAVREG